MTLLPSTVDKLQFEPPLRKETEAHSEMVMRAFSEGNSFAPAAVFFFFNSSSHSYLLVVLFVFFCSAGCEQRRIRFALGFVCRRRNNEQVASPSHSLPCLCKADDCQLIVSEVSLGRRHRNLIPTVDTECEHRSSSSSPSSFSFTFFFPPDPAVSLTLTCMTLPL